VNLGGKNTDTQFGWRRSEDQRAARLPRCILRKKQKKLLLLVKRHGNLDINTVVREVFRLTRKSSAAYFGTKRNSTEGVRGEESAAI